METTMQPQEMTKEPMVELDTGGNAVDIELKQEKEIQVKEQKDEKVESKETKKEDKKDEREEYSKDVQKRIDRMTYKIREAERREKEALEFAKKIKKERKPMFAPNQLDKSIIFLVAPGRPAPN